MQHSTTIPFLLLLFNSNHHRQLLVELSCFTNNFLKFDHLSTGYQYEQKKKIHMKLLKGLNKGRNKDR